MHNEIIRPYDIMIVGEAWGDEEELQGQPFVGASGQVLNSMLRSAGINRDDCYLTSVFNFKPKGNKLDSLNGPPKECIPGWPRLANKLYIHKQYQPELDRLLEEVETIRPNVIIALGAVSLWALTKQLGIKKFRGTPLASFDGKYKVLPSYHPSAIMRQWKLRPIGISDLTKAKRESASPTIKRPSRKIYMEPSIDDIEWFYKKYVEQAPTLSADIETKQLTITEIGFAPTKDRALVIPFFDHERWGNYWPTAEEEFEAWRWVERYLEKPLIGQNFSYDIQYLWRKNHIKCNLIADDTMLLHHAMYPEMEKSLGFLGSIYTDEPSWKLMRSDNDTLKAED